MSNRLRVLGLFVLPLAGIVLAGVVQAAPFYWDPATKAPQWVTAAPYQRNIEWQFATDPEGGPTTSGAPGAQYEGTLDPILWDSDFVDLTGSVQWYNAYSTYSGLVGIDNRSGTETLTGTAVFHIDNTDDLGWKNLWMEYAWFGEGVTDLSFSILASNGSVVQSAYIVDFAFLPTMEILLGAYGAIEPNPTWEEVVFHFSVDPGAVLMLDNVHVATECVPEPATVVFFCTGLAGLALARRRKRA